MGYLRFLLAFSVVASHSGNVGPFRMIGGPDAVRIFFAVSGFYMALVLNERYRDLPLFIVNRVLRLYPAYLVVMLATLGWFGVSWWHMGHRPPPFWISDAMADLSEWQKVLFFASNWTMLGLDLPSLFHYRNHLLVFMPVDGDTEPLIGFWFGWAVWVRQAWSLGAELWFYLLAPLLVRRSVGVQAAVVGASLLVFVSLAPSHPLAYYFFPANLWLFMAGSLLYRASLALPRFKARWLIVPVALVLLFAGYLPDRLVVVGLLSCVVICIPFLFDASRNSRRDEFIGNLSYAVYLSHLLVIAVLAAVLKTSHPIAIFSATLLVSVFIAVYIEAPVESYRKTLRQRGSLFPSFGRVLRSSAHQR